MWAVCSTTTVLVDLFDIALSVFFPELRRENSSAQELAKEMIATILAAAGVLLANRNATHARDCLNLIGLRRSVEQSASPSAMSEIG